MNVPRKKVLLIGAGVLVGTAALLVALRSGGGEAHYATAVVDRGDIAEIVGATGTLQAVTTVQVGSQVSGTVQQLLVDFNSRVKKDQVVARLDPSLFQARLGQAQANLVAARANVERQQSAVEDARLKLARAEELAREELLAAADLDTARTTLSGAAAQLKANQAAVIQAVAGVTQAQVDLAHTVIQAPIDGIVVGRSVDVGQTVAASLQAPTLFVIAQDLSQMQVLASIDEADIGRVHTGQTATFHVDSYPDQTFEGRVEQVRLQPTTVQNVVTYSAIIAIGNPGQRLMPGMTATVSVIVQKRDGVLRIPAAALRFRPPEGAAPAAAQAQGGGRSGAAAAGGGGTARAAEGQAAPGSGESPRGRGEAPPGGWQQRGGPRAEGAGAASPGAAGDGGDHGRPATIYVPGPKDGPQPQRIRVGMSDAQFVEVLSGLEEGAQVITGTSGTAGAGARPSTGPSSTPSNNPFAPGRTQRRQR